jgi:glycosyltransferase involved in cell wall biosynthesis
VSTERVLVCIPTYNERDNLPSTLGRLRAACPDVDILVIDDGSPDGTGKIADEAAAEDPKLHVLHRAGKSGLGTAYVKGFGWGLERGFDVLVEMDADGSHQPEELPRLLAPLMAQKSGTRADVVLGSRYVDGGVVRNWPNRRLLLSRGGNAYVRIALGLPLRDATGGFRAYRSAVLRSLPLEEVSSQGYCFQVDLVWQAWRAGYRVVEVPITFVEREIGESKMSNAIVTEALWRVTWWGLRTGPRGRRQGTLPADSAAHQVAGKTAEKTPRDTSEKAVEKSLPDAPDTKNPPPSRGTTGEGSARRL